MEDFHQYQQEGHTCGVACIQMVLSYVTGKNKDTEELKTACECSTTTGVTDVGMKKGLEFAGLHSERNLRYKEEETAINYLDRILDKNNVFIMRTLTRGIKHWIVIYKKSNEKYKVLDPWLGVIQYNQDKILDIWSARDYDGFEVFTQSNLNEAMLNFKIENASRKDLPEILDVAEPIFKNEMARSMLKMYLEGTVDWSLPNKKATVDGKIIGFYLFNGESVAEFGGQLEDLSKYKDKKGIQGLILGVDKKYRGWNVGRKLRAIPLQFKNFDYVWGQQFDTLKNLENWTRSGRRLVAKGGGINVTLIDLRESMKFSEIITQLVE